MSTQSNKPSANLSKNKLLGEEQKLLKKQLYNWLKNNLILLKPIKIE